METATLTPVKKVSANDTIFMMVQAINQQNQPLFYKAVDEYAKTFVYSSDVGQRLRRLCNQRPMEMITLSQLSANIKRLIVVGDHTGQNVFMNDDLKQTVDELIQEWKCIDEFKLHNLPVRSKILLHGPTGNGKTTIAREIARLSERDFIEMNTEEITCSTIGTTAANISKLLNEIKIPCVLFWDEIDSLGATRIDDIKHAADQENNRTINSILVNIERMSDKVVLIGATNRKMALDSALLRRFDEMIEIKAPSYEEMVAYRDNLGNHYNIPWMQVESMVVSDCKNYSEIKDRFIKIARRYVMSNSIPKLTGAIATGV